MVGLVEAADRYNTNRAEPFLAFAEHRIRGAVLDELRRGDMLPRRKRQLARKAQQVRQQLEQGGSAPTDEQVATALGVTVEQYRSDVAPLAQVEVTVLAPASAITHHTPYVVATYRQALSRLDAELSQLDTREASIIDMHYNQQLSYSQIASSLSISPARVCQLMNRALDRLRGTLSAKLGPAAAAA